MVTKAGRALRTRAFDIMEYQGLTMAWLMRRTGYSRSYLQHVKAGDYPITDEVIKRFVFAFDLPEELLFFCDEARLSGVNDRSNTPQPNQEAQETASEQPEVS